MKRVRANRKRWRDFGRHIRRLRTEAFMSQAELARTAKISGTYLSFIERGMTPPPTTMRIIDLAKALDVDKDWLIAAAGRLPLDVEKVIAARTAETIRLIRGMDRSGPQ